MEDALQFFLDGGCLPQPANRNSVIVVIAETHLVEIAGIPIPYKMLAETENMVPAKMRLMCSVYPGRTFMPQAFAYVIDPGTIPVRHIQHPEDMSAIRVGIGNKIGDIRLLR